MPFMIRAGWGKTSSVSLHMRFIISDPDDCERISRVHIRKDTSYQPGTFDSVIATLDKDDWREQRDHLNEAFLPLSSLARIMPVSLQRAKHCAERIWNENKGAAVDISDFFLH